MADEEKRWLEIQDYEIVKATKISDPFTLNQVLGNLAADIVMCLHDNLKEQDPPISDTGELGRSIRMPIKLFGSVLTATLYLEDYFDYVNKGVEGIGGNRKTGSKEAWVLRNTIGEYQFKRGPQVSMIKKWAEKRGLNAYAVRTSIAYRGLKSRPFYDECIAQSFKGDLWDRFKNQIRVVSDKNITRQLKSSIVSKGKVKNK